MTTTLDMEESILALEGRPFHMRVLPTPSVVAQNSQQPYSILRKTGRLCELIRIQELLGFSTQAESSELVMCAATL